MMTFARAALAGTILTLSATAAFATEPIVGIPIGIDHEPEGIIARATTDRDGKVVFPDLAPGNYVLVIDGPGLVASMDRILQPPPKKSGGGLSIGVGGMFGGGGSHRSTTGGPAGGGSHGGTHSGGGISLQVASADVNGDGVDDSTVRPGHPGDQPGYPITAINIVLPSSADSNTANWGSGTSLVFNAPYCRDAASHGMRIGFSVPKGSRGPVTLSVWQLMQGQTHN